MTKAKAKAADVPFAVPDWPATRVEMVKLSEIIPYDKNPRTHSPEQVALIAKSMTEDGVLMPILCDEKRVIIAGHGRRLGALQNKFEEYPVVTARGWSEEKKRAVRIKDNQLGLLSGWDEALLNSEMSALQLSGYEMPTLGFSEQQLSEMVIEPSLAGGEPLERVLSDEEAVALNTAWKNTVEDWAGILDGFQKGGFLSAQFTKGALAVYFMRARLYGDDIPRAATLPYTGHRLFVNGDKNGSISDFLHLKFDTAPKKTPSIESIQWFCGGRPSLDKFVSGTLPFAAYRQPADFPAILARKLINEFVTVKNGRVLDPCHGWGGRALGFLLSDNAAHYHGFDVDPKTQSGVQSMTNDLKQFALGEKNVELTLCPFEDSKLTPSSYDFALTSPPYFDTEKYNGDDSSWRRYGDFEKWVEGFYSPLIIKTAAALKPGATFALQIGNQRYPLEDAARKVIASIDLDFVEKRTTEMVNNLGGTDPQDGETVLILRKAGGAKTQTKKNAAAQFGEPL